MTTLAADKPRNISHARSLIEQATGLGAQLVVLPEDWNSPYSHDRWEDGWSPVRMGMVWAAGGAPPRAPTRNARGASSLPHHPPRFVAPGTCSGHHLVPMPVSLVVIITSRSASAAAWLPWKLLPLVGHQRHLCGMPLPALPTAARPQDSCSAAH